MNNKNINPEKITKPIQLLGAWLAGLFSIDSCFLVAATNFPEGSWESMILVVAAIVNVPLFLIAVFILQTKFRPELQEDSYYSTYLSRKSNEVIKVKKDESHIVELRQLIEGVENRVVTSLKDIKITDSGFSNLLFGINKNLSDKELIKTKLADLGILKSTVFGAPEPPQSRIASISKYLPKQVIPEILNLLVNLNFDGYNFYDNIEETTEEDILLGSYGNSDYEILKKAHKQI
ncbi:MAG: hypothetical protein KJ915_13695 [Candidatus Omnitrophica bacterium]|nr:hypothetical protein [Candidatus Omnitrophota bacterium]